MDPRYQKLTTIAFLAFLTFSVAYFSWSWWDKQRTRRELHEATEAVRNRVQAAPFTATPNMN